jgi:predicted TIM-barrel fold metal-dependent hydrolase
MLYLCRMPVSLRCGLFTPAVQEPFSLERERNSKVVFREQSKVYAMAFKTRKLKKLFSKYIKENIIITTSGKYQPEGSRVRRNRDGADRILFATDYPFGTPEEAVEYVEKFPISDSNKEKIYHLNAERLMRL